MANIFDLFSTTTSSNFSKTRLDPKESIVSLANKVRPVNGVVKKRPRLPAKNLIKEHINVRSTRPLCRRREQPSTAAIGYGTSIERRLYYFTSCNTDSGATQRIRTKQALFKPSLEITKAIKASSKETQFGRATRVGSDLRHHQNRDEASTTSSSLGSDIQSSAFTSGDFDRFIELIKSTVSFTEELSASKIDEDESPSTTTEAMASSEQLGTIISLRDAIESVSVFGLNVKEAHYAIKKRWRHYRRDNGIVSISKRKAGSTLIAARDTGKPSASNSDQGTAVNFDQDSDENGESVEDGCCFTGDDDLDLKLINELIEKAVSLSAVAASQKLECSTLLRQQRALRDRLVDAHRERMMLARPKSPPSPIDRLTLSTSALQSRQYTVAQRRPIGIAGKQFVGNYQGIYRSNRVNGERVWSTSINEKGVIEHTAAPIHPFVYKRFNLFKKTRPV